MRLEEGTVVGREVHGSSDVVVATVVGLVMDGGVVGRGVVVATAHEVGLVLGEGVYDQTACHMYSSPLYTEVHVTSWCLVLILVSDNTVIIATVLSSYLGEEGF